MTVFTDQLSVGNSVQRGDRINKCNWQLENALYKAYKQVLERTQTVLLGFTIPDKSSDAVDILTNLAYTSFFIRLKHLILFLQVMVP